MNWRQLLVRLNFFQSMEHEEQRGAFICNTRELLLTRKLVTLIPTIPEAACIHCSILVIIRAATCDQTSPRNAHAHTPSTFSASHTWQLYTILSVFWVQCLVQSHSWSL